MTIKINHMAVVDMDKSGLFKNITSYTKLNDAILRYGNNPSTKDRNSLIGEANEVCMLYWLHRFGAQTDVNLYEVEGTSDNKFNKGYDFSAKNIRGERVLIQVKWSENPCHKYKHLDSFFSESKIQDVKNENMFFMTNINGKELFFDNRISTTINVVDRSWQERHIDRTPSYYLDLCQCIEESARPSQSKQIPPLWSHQQKMLDACTKALEEQYTIEAIRRKLICATGGGKTLVEFLLFMESYKRGHDIGVIVAPTIGLLNQHHAKYAEYGMFRENGVLPVFFHTGKKVSDVVDLAHSEFTQTTDGDHLVDFVTKHRGSRILVFTTYASEFNLFNVFKNNKTLSNSGIDIDVAIFDEMHHTVKQQDAIEYKKHLQTLPVKYIYFFSASEKYGRTISSDDIELYGEKVSDITYRELAQAGVVVPKIRVVFLHLDKNRLRDLKSSLIVEAEARGIEIDIDQDEKIANNHKFRLDDILLEAGSLPIVVDDLTKEFGFINVITYAKSVPGCRFIVDSEMVKSLIPNTLLQMVSAKTSGDDRKDAFKKMKASNNSVMLQHSIMVEGIDSPTSNAVVLFRDMEIIATQQATGRVVRALEVDRDNLIAGKISLDSPVGWEKYYATVYVIVDGDGDYSEFVRDFCVKLQSGGLGDGDVQFVDLKDERHSSEPGSEPVSPKVYKDILVTSDAYAQSIWIEVLKEGEEKVEDRELRTPGNLGTPIKNKWFEPTKSRGYQ